MIALTEQIAEYAAKLRYEDLPGNVIEVQKRSLADGLACMVAGTGYSKESRLFTSYALSQSRGGRCTLLGSDEKTLPGLAALANGALSHVLDFEDSHEKALVHPNAVSIPTLMALAQETGNISGKEFLTAMVVASDVCCRLDLAIKEDLLKYGWNMPPIHGGMGAVMGAANMLRLDAGQIQDAIAIQMTSMSSSGQAALSRDSVIRAVRDGFAAQSAVGAVLLAREGLPARFDRALEGELGYFHAYARGHYEPEAVLEGLGERFESANISFKPWPCCRATHAALEIVRNLARQNEIKPEDVENIHIVMQEIGRMVFEPVEVKYRPKLAEIAKLSMPFVIATMLEYGTVELESFSAQRLSDPKIAGLAQKVTYEIDKTLTKASNKQTIVTIKMNDGRSYTAENRFPLGCVENPLSDEDMYSKFFDCMSAGIKKFSAEKIKRIFNIIMNIEKEQNINDLFVML